jgi:carbon storage regulator
MLVLSRKVGEIITIGSSIKVTVLSYDRGIVRLGIEAPKSIPVHRKEVFDKIIDMNRQAAKTELAALKKAISDSKVNFHSHSKGQLQPPSVYYSAKDNKKN